MSSSPLPSHIPRRTFICPHFQTSPEAKTLDLYDPFTTNKIDSIYIATQTEVNEAVVQAREALRRTTGNSWETPKNRRDWIYKIANAIEKERELFVKVEGHSGGKWYGSADYDIGVVIECFKYFAGFSEKLSGKYYESAGKVTSHTEKEPVGVVALITSFNYPLMLTVWKLAPALAAGNSVLIKPSDNTPLSLLLFADLLQRIGFPAGVISVLPGDATVGKALVEHMDIDKISFTGSTPVGRMILTAAAKTNLKRVTVELGGKSPIIIDENWKDMDKLCDDIFGAIFFNQGQNCCAGTRLYIHEKIQQQFLAAFKIRCQKFKPGNPWASSTPDQSFDWGPLQNKMQFDKVKEFIAKGQREGSSLLVGGGCKGSDGEGWFVEPTVFYDVEDNSCLCEEEIFGPVLTILKPWNNLDDVLRRANSGPFGLAAGVFTTDYNVARKAISKLRAGTVWWNTYNVVNVHVPFGGLKGGSGYGKDLGEEGMEEWSVSKTVTIWSDQ